MCWPLSSGVARPIFSSCAAAPLLVAKLQQSESIDWPAFLRQAKTGCSSGLAPGKQSRAWISAAYALTSSIS